MYICKFLLLYETVFFFPSFSYSQNKERVRLLHVYNYEDKCYDNNLSFASYIYRILNPYFFFRPLFRYK